jgi:hypothetical protein
MLIYFPFGINKSYSFCCLKLGSIHMIFSCMIFHLCCVKLQYLYIVEVVIIMDMFKLLNLHISLDHIKIKLINHKKKKRKIEHKEMRSANVV